MMKGKIIRISLKAALTSTTSFAEGDIGVATNIAKWEI
jgi:hypothetical protein